VNSTGPGSGTHTQAVIAVLDAKPNCAEEPAALVRRLTPHVRAEPGCLGFIPYRAQTNAGRIYIYEVYPDAGAFDAHLQADHVREFIAALPAVTTDDGRESAVQLDVLDGSAPETGT
jgi:quinol monooxygenase YgiN